jgi:hypothetical protein
MADVKVIEGMVEQLEAEDATKKGRWGSAKIGGNFYKYSDPQYRDAAWNPPTNVGQTVKLRFTESAYIKQDGTPGITRWVSGIETLAVFTEPDDIEYEDDSATNRRRDSSKVLDTNTSIQRQVALKAAVDTCITLFAEDKYETPDARIEAVLQAYTAYSGALAQE